MHNQYYRSSFLFCKKNFTGCWQVIVPPVKTDIGLSILVDTGAVRKFRVRPAFQADLKIHFKIHFNVLMALMREEGDRVCEALFHQSVLFFSPLERLRYLPVAELFFVLRPVTCGLIRAGGLPAFSAFRQ
ncbi:hypothetical protein [Klebsiella aerogenes]|uniref:hypothetical protein n=1 Tax=Klebsiella aerogenes TaxID=548 RepID=UPI0013A64559|nr:hypothetical protein [Klebsiella aerogenes]HCB2864878.1 hypothetical protein [Klebsiella aerogenes]HCB2881523.1 hypothetical protein [Klebsiella aerogenes]HCM5948980.1 hypothetical protein [Klebsiella aerogenes]HCM7749079.1 hypothetical protein [Klebsiella aerogenes]HDW2142422.1 hypothetical protein [Klebsiella aerogenes]